MKEKRKDFPLLSSPSPPIYLDSAATALKPYSVIKKIQEYYECYPANVHRASYNLSIRASEEYEKARETVRGFLHANDSYEIIFTSGTTEGVNYISTAYIIEALHHPHNKKGAITVSELDHHSVFVPWQTASTYTNSQFLIIPLTDDGEICLETAYKYISKSTILCISGMSNVTGYIPPIASLHAVCQKANCKLIIDGAQLLAHGSFSLKDTPVDAIAFSSHKLCGPTGIGCLCIKKDWLATLPFLKSGGGTIETVTLDTTTFLKGHERYEAGTPHIAGAIGFSEALSYLQNIGASKIKSHEKKLRSAIIQTLQSCKDIRIIGDESISDSAIISFIHKKLHVQDIGFVLQKNNICIRTGHLCAQPLLKRFNCSYVARISGYFYTTLEEIQKLGRVLQSFQSL